MTDIENHDREIIENDNLSPEDQMRAQLSVLKQQHRQLDEEITAALETGTIDMISIQRMKKVKLSLKDKIVALKIKLTPDIIA